ncbi:hypothetical protein [Kribbella sp. NPDC048928]|uniref:hypothetical protein n=1 Tax=Kribbella sp. NPDC048928 TaxID=3364111 RepID=UPI00371D356E
MTPELWATLLDRSFELIAVASEDARRFDRPLIVRASDVWDNNIGPFFGAAVARGPRRTELVESGVRWMADFGSERRQWVLDQAAAAGHPLTLPPPSNLGGVQRDYRGLVRAPQLVVTQAVAAEIADDYDLAAAQVQSLVVERSAGGLVGSLRVAVGRRFEIGHDEAPAAELDLRFDGIDELRFDLGDSIGINLDGEVAIGGGVLRADRVTAWIDDLWWHLSAAGKAVDVLIPEGPSARPSDPGGHPIGGTAVLAAMLLRRAMLEIRMVRSAAYADKIPVHQIAQAFRGAGVAVVTAGTVRWRREAAFRRLVERWIAAGGDDLAQFFHAALTEIADDEYAPNSVRSLALSLCPGAVDVEAVDLEAVEVEAGGEVVLVAYNAGTGPHPSRLRVQSAVPLGGRWTLRGHEAGEPESLAVDLRSGRLLVRT